MYYLPLTSESLSAAPVIIWSALTMDDSFSISSGYSLGTLAIIQDILYSIIQYYTVIDIGSDLTYDEIRHSSTFQ